MDFTSGVFVARSDISEAGMLVGYAAVYGQATTRKGTGMTWQGTEEIARGAFDGNMSDSVMLTVNHDPNQLLATTVGETLRLESDATGLRFEADLADTQLGRDMRVMVKRGDMAGSSFRAYGPLVNRVKGGVVLARFDQLLDVTICSRGAYAGAAVMARNEDPAWVRDQLVRARARVLFGGK